MKSLSADNINERNNNILSEKYDYSDRKENFFISAKNLIEKERIYLLFPFGIMLFNILITKTNFGHYIGVGSDIRAFYYGIINTWYNPENAYNSSIYMEMEPVAWPYMYLPFFALLYYPFTLWGIEVFAIIFYFGGIIFFIISVIIWEKFFDKRRINWYSRIIWYSIITMGPHYAWNFLFNQSKLYVLGLISCILWLNEENKSKLLINILFIWLISIMTHLVFFYIYYLLKNIFQRKEKRYEKYNNFYYKSSSLQKKRIELEFSWNVVFKEISLAASVLILGNILFILKPGLLQSYIKHITQEFFVAEYNYEIRAHNSVLGYFFYEQNITFEWMYITSIIFLVITIILFFTKTSLWDSIAIFCMLIIFIDPLNEEHYFVFLFPTLAVWIAHNIGKNNTIPKYFDWFIKIFWLILVNIHLFLYPYYLKGLFYFIFLCFLVIERRYLSKNLNNT